MRNTLTFHDVTLPNSPQESPPDTIQELLTHLEFTNTADGQNQGGSGSHDVTF